MITHKKQKLNQFLKTILVKKKQIKLLKNFYIYNLKSKRFCIDIVVAYIIKISFSKSNTLLQVTNSTTGTLKFQYSSGNLFYKGKLKKARMLILNTLFKKMIKKFKFLKYKPIALHLKNVKFIKFWIFNKLKNKIFIKLVKNFNTFSHNGCRKKKL